jgi:AcrR family transcriptional regulator
MSSTAGMTAAEIPRLDRRQRKSRAALQAALTTLIARKAYAEITIDDVAETADVARATFYAHYNDKTALLVAATEQLIDDMASDVTAVSWVGAGTDWHFDGSGLLALLGHVERNRDLYRLVISGEGGPLPRRSLIETFQTTARGVFTAGQQHGRKPRQSLDLTVTAFVGALLAVVEDWISASDRLDAGDLAVSFMQQQAGGLEWALGFEPGQLVYSHE